MRTVICTVIGCLASVSALAAKPPIDASAYAQWPSVGSASLSDDGRYASYALEPDSRLVILATDKSWKLELAETPPSVQFTRDSRYALLQKAEDKLVIVKLGSTSEELENVESFKLPEQGNGQWLAYRLKQPEGQLVLRDLWSGHAQRYDNVNDYHFGRDSQTLLLITREGDAEQILSRLELDSGRTVEIWRGHSVGPLILEESGRHLAFAGQKTQADTVGPSFWYHSAGAEEARLLLDAQSANLGPGLQLEGISRFIQGGRSLLITLKPLEPPPAAANPEAVKINVWSYTDAKLQSEQIKSPAISWLTPPKSNYAAVLQIATRKILRLEQSHERLGSTAFNRKVGEVGLLDSCAGEAGLLEQHWNKLAECTSYLVFLNGGRRVRMPRDGLPELSPEGQFVVHYDLAQKAYFSFEVASGRLRNISQGISPVWTAAEAEWDPPGAKYPRGIAGWIEDDAAVLIYDRYDIWLMDLKGIRAPANITNGYGSRHDTVFSFSSDSSSRKPLAMDQRIILTAFNKTTKDNGFFAVRMTEKSEPALLTMGPYLYTDAGGLGLLPTANAGVPPIKAANAELHIVRRSSAKESPNYFITRDFKSFAPLSEVYPERQYNWLTSELVTWKTLDGQLAQGILYKPENFDPQKKYPVIFHYYELAADGLHSYPKPQAEMCNINVPTYVSNGYLVFTPDIYLKTGQIKDSVVNSVVAAAQHLNQMPWVEGQRMGIQGCSFGGIGTNLLVTHTDLFAAACSNSGMANLISGSGSLGGTGASLQGMYEKGQFRMGALWEQPDWYIENSAIFRIDKITTPLLMMHTPSDGVTPFYDAVAFFTGLRRLGKTAWMLEYEDGDHGVWGKSGEDFALRMRQFFDHYLKDAPPPKWMTEGIPARLKGIETGLELDTSGKKPGPGLCCADTSSARQ